MRATAPVRSGISTRRKVNQVNGAVEEESKNRNKCWLCKSSNHWPDQCQKLAAMAVDERLKVVRENHVCFSCLKKAGRDHRQANCSRRRQCNKFENGSQCTSSHHPLLHKSTTVGVPWHQLPAKRTPCYQRSLPAFAVQTVCTSAVMSFWIREHR